MRIVRLTAYLCLAMLFALSGCVKDNFRLMLETGDWKGIQEDATRRIAQNPNDAKAYRQRVSAYMAEEKLGEALDDFAKLTRLKGRALDGNDWAMWHTLQNELSRLNQTHLLDTLPEDVRIILVAPGTELPAYTPEPGIPQQDSTPDINRVIPETPRVGEMPRS